MSGILIGTAALVICAAVAWGATVLLAEAQLELLESAEDRDLF
ncbi:hypothetical protein [Frondihabitans sp. PAMC 28766]|nr:hypothetical protein [Frondihabitans sp. PAMC 28766]